VCHRIQPRRGTSRWGAADNNHNPASLSSSQLGALGRGVIRELLWALRLVAFETHNWRARAARIPAPEIRADALSSLDRKRGHTDGAALFCVLPTHRNHALLRLLVAYEVIWDFLDSVNEHGAQAGQRNGLQLHLALIDALDIARPISDYYRFHPWSDDGGYLRALVDTCRGCVSQLPSYDLVRPLLVREAARAQVLGINHDLDPGRRERSLRAWANSEFPAERSLAWFELSGAASASLTVHALLALAAEASSTEEEIARVCGAYFPWISAATTMLDSYVDQAEDAANKDHSYIGHYASSEVATARTGRLLRRSLVEARGLPHGERHVLIVSCMAAMYLSKDSARALHLQHATHRLIASGGSMSRLLLPILRLWRIAYAQRST
jgi:tetraprenyl-beta-curcumene synthase